MDMALYSCQQSFTRVLIADTHRTPYHTPTGAPHRHHALLAHRAGHRGVRALRASLLSFSLCRLSDPALLRLLHHLLQLLCAALAPSNMVTICRAQCDRCCGGMRMNVGWCPCCAARALSIHVVR